MELERAEIGVDGNCGYALLGENLQEGEAEFEPIVPFKDETMYNAERRAMAKAFRRLKERIGRPISYFVRP